MPNVMRHFMPLMLLALAVIVSTTSCDNDTDLTPPTFTALQWWPQPDTGLVCGTPEPTVFKVKGGDTVAFEALFQDDVALSQYKVDVHNNFDCHGHGAGAPAGTTPPQVASQTLDWTVLHIGDLTGTSANITERLAVPTNATAGTYHFHVQVIDEAGNDDPAANYYAIQVQHPLDSLAPQLAVSAPSTNSLTLARGSSVRFQGYVTDDRSLSDGGNGLLFLTYTDLNSGNTFTTDQVFTFDSSVGTRYDFDFQYTPATTLPTGNYRLSLYAFDGVRNVAAPHTIEMTLTR